VDVKPLSAVTRPWIRRRVGGARRLLDQGDPRGAVRSLRRALRVAPRSGELTYWLGMATWQAAYPTDDVEEPKALIARAAELGHDDPGLLVRCAAAMVEMAGTEQIAPWVERARTLAGKDFPLANELDWLTGCVYWIRGDPERAEPLLRTAFYANPEHNYGVQLADTYVDLQRYDEALVTVEEGLRRGGEHPALRDMREWLTFRRDNPDAPHGEATPSLLTQSAPEIRIAELAEPGGVVQGRTFSGVRVRGPAILGLGDDCEFDGNYYYGTPETLFIEAFPDEYPAEAIGVTGVRFERCEFHEIRLAAPREIIEEFLRGLQPQ
jgi:hypothetical protein